MNTKILITGTLILGLVILFYAYFLYGDNNQYISSLNENKPQREPIIIKSNGSYEEMSLDTLVTESDLIVVGTVDKIHPGRWNTLDGKLPEGTTVLTITPDKVIFTDVDLSVNQMIKGQSNQNIVRIRSLGGIVEQDQMIVSGVASLEMGQTYLLFLGKDTGSTAEINPGHFFVKGGLQGLYQISDGRARSIRDEWQLEELISYIETSLSQPAIP